MLRLITLTQCPQELQTSGSEDRTARCLSATARLKVTSLLALQYHLKSHKFNIRFSCLKLFKASHSLWMLFIFPSMEYKNSFTIRDLFIPPCSPHFCLVPSPIFPDPLLFHNSGLKSDILRKALFESSVSDSPP